MAKGTEDKRLGWKLKLILALTQRAAVYAPSYLPLRLVQMFFEILGPFLIAVPPALVLDQLVSRAHPERLLFLAGITVLLGGLSGLADYLLRRRLEQDAFVINQKIELSINEAFQRMDYEKLEDPSIQDLSQLARDTNNHASSLESMISTFFILIGQCVSLAGMAAILLRLLLTDGRPVALTGVPGWLAGNALICLLAALGFCVLSSQMDGILLKIYGHYDQKFAALGREYKYYGQLAREEAYVKDLRVFRLYGLINKRIQSYCIRNKKLTNEVNVPEMLIGIAEDLLMALELILVYAMVSCKVLAGVISIGEFYLYVTALTQAIVLVKGILESKNSIERCLMYQRAYRDIISLASTPGRLEEKGQAVPQEGELVFEQVTFTYPGGEAPVLEAVSFALHEGEKLALVGRNGAGKTTIVKLMLGLYTPQQGRILWIGQDIREIPYEKYIRSFGAVFQDFKLVAASLAENVAMGEAGDRAEIMRALDAAGLSGLLPRLSKSIDTQLLRKFDQEGVNLSGGEAQKIAIARAFYKNAPVLILDEPTAALDPISEQDIFKVIQGNLQGKTAVFISHRLSACRICDRILVLDRGRVLQQGPHHILAAQEGLYRRMWETQKSFYVEF
ncbi:lipid A export ATP-binding/permease protein MsbA [Lachnospiraceae bacterium]|nr:lipid A export ATP-binding/permease protein MsbA [Lachnospiraceae bacterium]